MSAELERYRDKGLAGGVGFGSKPAVLVVDLILGFTDGSSPLGSDLEAVVAATGRLLEAARRVSAPVLFTTTAYDAGGAEAGVFLAKVPSLAVLERGSRWVELDARLGRRSDEVLVEKQYASAFFGTPLASLLTVARADTLIVAGATTSGCVRATVVDGLQHGLRVIVPEECVGDRSAEAHRANLFDIEGKYGDVVPLAAVLDYLGELGGQG